MMKQNYLLPILASVVFAAMVAIPAAAGEKSSALKPAYYIVEFKVTDPEGIKPYSSNVESTFRPYGGRFIVRGGGDIASLEGATVDNRVVVIQFDSLEKARAWYDSPEYKKLRTIRYRSATSRAFIVDGVAS